MIWCVSKTIENYISIQLSLALYVIFTKLVGTQNKFHILQICMKIFSDSLKSNGNVKFVKFAREA